TCGAPGPDCPLASAPARIRLAWAQPRARAERGASEDADLTGPAEARSPARDGAMPAAAGECPSSGRIEVPSTVAPTHALAPTQATPAAALVSRALRPPPANSAAAPARDPPTAAPRAYTAGSGERIASACSSARVFSSSEGAHGSRAPRWRRWRATPSAYALQPA